MHCFYYYYDRLHINYKQVGEAEGYSKELVRTVILNVQGSKNACLSDGGGDGVLKKYFFARQKLYFENKKHPLRGVLHGCTCRVWTGHAKRFNRIQRFCRGLQPAKLLL